MEDPTATISTRQSRDMIYPEPTGSMLNGTMPNRVPIEINRRSTAVAAQRLPFEIFIRDADIVAAAGVIVSTYVAETVKAAPANGIWYLQAKVVINNTNGTVTSSVIEWVSTQGTNTATTFHLTIGLAEVVSGVIVPLSPINYTYGPIMVSIFGGINDKWTALLF